MSDEEFQAFNKIGQYKGFGMSITQKIHGTNAQILIRKLDNGEWLFRTGSRTRWIAPGDDNYGFAAWAYSNKEMLIDALGEGQHFGEWAGPGINSGEGLAEKTFILFDWKHHANNFIKNGCPKNVLLVPVLMYGGRFTDENINGVMNALKENGSYLVPGFMRPEGIVININGTLYKKVFDAEETQWKQPDKIKVSSAELIDVSHLLQPIRMEKIISRDQNNITNFPRSLPDICKAYAQDLEDEKQLIYSSEEERKGIFKALGKYVFSLAKSVMAENFNN